MVIRKKSGPSDAPRPTRLGSINSSSQQLLQQAVAGQQLAADMSCPFQAGVQGYASLLQPVEVFRARDTPALFADRYAPLPDRSGDTCIEASKVAILVANGSDGPMVRAIYTALLNDGAVPRLVGSHLGKIQARDKSVLDIEITLEAGPPLLYDALVVPDGEAAIASLARDADALNFVREQYRHSKPILAMGAGARLLRQASVPPSVPASDGLAPALAAFKQALGSQRAFAREAGQLL